MTQFTLDTGIIHFIGIGGIGMSGIAEVLFDLGYQVRGSDILENSNIDRLRKKGITIYIGQNEKNMNNASVAVVSSAIKSDNKELSPKSIVFINISNCCSKYVLSSEIACFLSATVW